MISAFDNKYLVILKHLLVGCQNARSLDAALDKQTLVLDATDLKAVSSTDRRLKETGTEEFRLFCTATCGI